MFDISCKKCSKQYTRETKDNFRLWYNKYKSNDRKFQRGWSCTQEHFFQEQGFLKDVSITLIDKTDASDCKNRKNYCMRTLRTLAPDAFNVEDSVWTIMIFHALICDTGLDCIWTTISWNTIFVFILYLNCILICIYFGWRGRRFVVGVNGLKSLTVATKSPVLDVWLGFESASNETYRRELLEE